MPTAEKLTAFLEGKKIPFEIISHPQAFTAQEVAHAIHKTGKVLAKTVVLDAGGKIVMAVVPAHQKVDLEAVKKTLSVESVHLVAEDRLRELFPESDLGAMPPIGPLYTLPVIVSESLTANPEIIFNACTHTECVKMKIDDFTRVVSPTVAAIGEIPASAR